MLMNSPDYFSTIEQIKQKIRTLQYRATLHVNADHLLLCHSIGLIINAHKSWGKNLLRICADTVCTNSPVTQCSVFRLNFCAF